MDSVTAAYALMFKESKPQYINPRNVKLFEDAPPPPATEAAPKKLAVELDPLDHRILVGIMSGQKVLPEFQKRAEELKKWFAALK
jgi:hypothetical protein